MTGRDTLVRFGLDLAAAMILISAFHVFASTEPSVLRGFTLGLFLSFIGHVHQRIGAYFEAKRHYFAFAVMMDSLSEDHQNAVLEVMIPEHIERAITERDSRIRAAMKKKGGGESE